LTEKLGVFTSRFVPGPPKRFAQFVGLLFAVTGFIFRFFGFYLTSWIILGCLFAASFLAGVFGICLACAFFRFAINAGIAPPSVYESCAVSYTNSQPLASTNKSTLALNKSISNSLNYSKDSSLNIQ